MKKALIIFSGGQDSTVCLIQALRQYEEVICITFDYGQKHLIEVNIAKKISIYLGVKKHKTVNFNLLKTLSESSLLINDKVSTQNYKNNLPDTFVPGRNILFLTLAAIYAYKLEINVIITGVCETDFSGYPDCRDCFIKAMNNAINLGFMRKLDFITPLMHLNKAEIWALADHYHQLNWVRHNTLTCYNGIIGDGCAQCASCNLRARGLACYLKKPKETMESLKRKMKLF